MSGRIGEDDLLPQKPKHSKECIECNTPVKTEIKSESSFAYKNAIILAPMVRICSLAFRTLCALYGADLTFTEEIVAAKLARSQREVVYYPSISSPIAEYVVYESYKHTVKRSVVFATVAKAENNEQIKELTTDKLHFDFEPRFAMLYKDKLNQSTTAECTLATNVECKKTEHVPVILQLGVADPCLASVAVERCATDVDGVDLNMGCPKKFSVGNGFGAVLMEQPEKAGAILFAVRNALFKLQKNKCMKNLPFDDNNTFLTSSIETSADSKDVSEANAQNTHHCSTLIENCKTCKLVSFKTRLKSTALATAEMLRSVLIHARHSHKHKCVDAITIHAREREQHSSETPQYAKAAETVRLCREDHLFDNIVFILNGSVLSRKDGVCKCHRWGFDAAMMARGAMWDATRFALDTQQPLNLMSSRTFQSVNNSNDTNCDEYIDYDRAHYMSYLKQLFIFSVRYRTSFANFKYHLTRTFPEVAVLKPLMKVVQQQLQSYSDCFAFFDCTTEEVNSLQYCLNSEQANCRKQGSVEHLENLSQQDLEVCTPSKRMKAET